VNETQLQGKGLVVKKMVNFSPIQCQPLKDNLSHHSKSKVNFGEADSFDLDYLKPDVLDLDAKKAEVNELKALSEDKDTPGILRAGMKAAFVVGSGIVAYTTYKTLLPKALNTVKSTFKKIIPKGVSDTVSAKSKQALELASTPFKTLNKLAKTKYADLKDGLKPESKLNDVLNFAEKQVAKVKNKVSNSLSQEGRAKIASIAEEVTAGAVGLSAGVQALQEINESSRNKRRCNDA